MSAVISAADARTPLQRAEALVGIPYVAARFDCMHLAVRAAREIFGRTLAWADGLPHPRGRRAQAAAFITMQAELARRVGPDEATDGDVLLFRNDAAAHPFHVGTLFIDECGQRWVLHVLDVGDSSRLQRLADCKRHGLILEGAYRWNEATTS